MVLVSEIPLARSHMICIFFFSPQSMIFLLGLCEHVLHVVVFYVEALIEDSGLFMSKWAQTDPFK